MTSHDFKYFKAVQNLTKNKQSYKIDVLKAYPFNDTKNVSQQSKVREQKGKTIHSNYFTATSISFTFEKEKVSNLQRLTKFNLKKPKKQWHD